MATLLEKQSGPFYDAWESLNEDQRQSHIRAALQQYVLYARQTSAFYADRLSAVDFQATHPLEKVPVLTADDLRTLVPPQGNLLLQKGLQGYTIFQSGGTTGTPKSTLFSSEELDGLDLPNARGFYACGLSESDRVANLFAVGSLYMTFVHINRMLQQYGCQNFPFSNHTPVEFIHTVVKLFNVNCMTGIASVVLNALRGFGPYGIEGIRIDKIFYGGEHLYEADKREIEAKFGTKIIRAPGYGTVDTWYIGYQCLSAGTGVFHAHDDQCFIEIVDEDTGKACAPGEIGMMYATAFPRRITPIVRYRVGDKARWLGEKCVCGRTTPLFQLIGRGDDVLRIGYDSVDYNAIQECILKVPELSGSVQMEKEREEGRDRLVIRVETDATVSERPGLSMRLQSLIEDSRPSLGGFVKKGTVWPVRVELVNPGTLERNPKTGKLIRVKDVRLS
jgi:phenylacetate-CoA ligase